MTEQTGQAPVNGFDDLELARKAMAAVDRLGEQYGHRNVAELQAPLLQAAQAHTLIDIGESLRAIAQALDEWVARG